MGWTRHDALDEIQSDVLGAWVEGRASTLLDLASVTGHGEAQVRAALDELVTTGFLERDMADAMLVGA